MNISATSWPIDMKFYLKHHKGGGKASVGFDPDWIRSLVSMVTDSSHRVKMGKTASSLFFRMLLIGSFSYLQVTMTCMRAWMSSKFDRIGSMTAELAALERMKKNPIDLKWGKRCHHIFSAFFKLELFHICRY